MPTRNRALMHLAVAGVIIALTFIGISCSSNAAGYTSMRYPIAAAGGVMIVVAAWRLDGTTGRASFSRKLTSELHRSMMASAPGWARLAWYLSFIGMLATLASTMGFLPPVGVDEVPPSDQVAVLELRTIAGLALLAFTHAALVFNHCGRRAIDDAHDTNQR